MGKKAEPKQSTAVILEDVGASEQAVAEAQQRVTDAQAMVADAQATLDAARAEHEEAAAAHAALTAPPPITGPRVKLEHTGEIIAVNPGEERERRLLVGGHNYEHVSDVTDQGETIWVYRRM